MCALGDVHFEYLQHPMEIDAQHSHQRKYTIGMVMVVRKFVQQSSNLYVRCNSCTFEFIFIHKIHQHGRHYSEQLIGVSQCGSEQQRLLLKYNFNSVKHYFGLESNFNGFIHAVGNNAV